MSPDLPVPPQYSHMAKAACLLLLHPHDNRIAVCSRRNSDSYGLPGGKMDPGETMAQTAVRETHEEIGVLVDTANVERLFADAIPGDRDFWVESFIAVSPTDQLQQMESDITVQWTTWERFLQHNAFKEYNAGVYQAYQSWLACQNLGKTYTLNTTHLNSSSSTPCP